MLFRELDVICSVTNHLIFAKKCVNDFMLELGYIVAKETVTRDFRPSVLSSINST
jgi:hypothetical protein